MRHLSARFVVTETGQGHALYIHHGCGASLVAVFEIKEQAEMAKAEAIREYTRRCMDDAMKDLHR